MTPNEGNGDELPERLLRGRRTLSGKEVSERVGISHEQARRFWNALGFPAAPEDRPLFTERDVAALRSAIGLIDSRWDEETALAMARAMARTADRLASWQVSLILETLVSADVPALAPVTDLEATLANSPESEPWNDELTPERCREVARLMLAAADDLEPLLVYIWRRHLTASVEQLLAQAKSETGSDSEPESKSQAQSDSQGDPTRPKRLAGPVRCVGFADMVGFTSLVSRLSERQLAGLVRRFELLASEVVSAHGGRIVKTLGDEVVFTTDGVAPAAAIALDLVESLEADPAMPRLRVGLGRGPVTFQLGDVFGTTVNRASRIAGIARPGAVVVDRATASSLTDVSGFEMRGLSPRALRGLGVIWVWELRRTAEPSRRGPTEQAAGHPVRWWPVDRATTERREHGL